MSRNPVNHKYCVFSGNSILPGIASMVLLGSLFYTHDKTDRPSLCHNNPWCSSADASKVATLTPGLLALWSSRRHAPVGREMCLYVVIDCLYISLQFYDCEALGMYPLSDP